MDWTIHGLTRAFDELIGFVPNLLAGLAILVLGYLIARGLDRITRSLTFRLGLDNLLLKMGITRNVTNPRAGSDAAGTAVFVVVVVATLIQASRALRLTFVADGLARLIAYLPHVFVAAIVFGATLYVGNWARERLLAPRFQKGAVGSFGFLPSAVRGLIIGAGVFMALRELQIAPEIVNAAFIIMLGAVGVAAALAFGLGGREVAGKIAGTWWARRSSGDGPKTPREPREPFARSST